MALQQVLRFEGREDLNHRHVDHVMGRSRPKTAIDRSAQGITNLTIFEDYNLADATIKLGEIAARGRRGRRARLVLVEAIIGGPPPYEQRVDDYGNVIPGQPKPWSQWKIRRWALRSIARIRRLVEANGKAKLCFAALHQDETSPHVHLAFVPLCGDGRLSWTHLKKEIAGVSTKREHHSKRTAARAMSALQDDYHKWVGRRYALGRGEPQSKTRRVHTAIDRVEAANRQAEIVRSRAAAEARQTIAEAEVEAKRIATEAAAEAEESRVIEALVADGEREERRAQLKQECDALASEKWSVKLELESLRRRETEANQRLVKVEINSDRRLDAAKGREAKAAEAEARVQTQKDELAETAAAVKQASELLTSQLEHHQQYLDTLGDQIDNQKTARGIALEQASKEREVVADLEARKHKLSKKLAAQARHLSKLTNNTQKTQKRRNTLVAETTALEWAYPGWLRKAPHLVELGEREALDETVKQAESRGFWKGVKWLGGLLRRVVHRMRFAPPVVAELVELATTYRDTQGHPFDPATWGARLEHREREFHEALVAQETARAREPDSPPTEERPARKRGVGIGE